MQKFVIKSIGRDAVEKSAGIITESYKEENLKYGFSGADDRGPVVEKLSNSLAANAKLYGAFYCDDQLGFFRLESQDEEIFELANLCVFPEYQRQGIGQLMLDFALEEAKGLGAVAVAGVINDENEAIKNWLIGNGFYEEASGYIQSLRYPVCLLQKELGPQREKSGEKCRGCNAVGCS